MESMLPLARIISKGCFVLSVGLVIWTIVLLTKVPAEVQKVKEARARSIANSQSIPIDPEKAKKRPELVDFIDWADASMASAESNSPWILTALALVPGLVAVPLALIGLVFRSHLKKRGASRS